MRWALGLVAMAVAGLVAPPPATAQPGPAPLSPVAAAPLPSLARVAAAARAAVITIRAPGAEPLDAPALGEDDEGCGPGGLDDPACAEEEDLGTRLARALHALRQRSLGAGVVVDPAGIAVTSARTVLLVPDFQVAAPDGSPVPATVVALDRRSDVAVLRLGDGGRRYAHLPLGDSARVEVGDRVLAVGAPHGLEGTVTTGIVTATPGRGGSPVGHYLQTDAATAPGNAGGPLVDTQGEVVGLVTLLAGEGVGYALPSRTVRAVLLELLEKGRVSRPWLGASTQTLAPDLARALGARDTAGVLVTDVAPHGPATRAGVRAGDIVLEMDGTRLSSRAQLERGVDAAAPGRQVRLRLRRVGRETTVAVTLAEEPDPRRVPAALARAWRLTGLRVRRLTPDLGVVADAVEPGSPAAGAGLEPDDLIREVNRRPVRSLPDFEAAVRGLRADEPVLLLVQRGDAVLYVALPPARD
jgi:S1-C subfamily serine protease